MAGEMICAAPVAALDRQAAVEKLYISNHDFMRELVSSDPYMTIKDQSQIIEGIAKHLPEYSGRLTDAAFQVWVTEIILPVTGFHAIRRVCQPFVRKAIWQNLGHSEEPSKYDDYPETVREIEQEVWLWTFLNLDKLKVRGRAKLTTRLFSRAAVMTRDWLKRQRTRRCAVIRRVYNLPKKSQMEGQKIAANLDREQLEADLERAEREEILEEMKKAEILG